MFGVLKRVFRKQAPKNTVFSGRQETSFARKPAEPAGRVIVPFAEITETAPATDGIVKVSYGGILAGLPQELHGKITPPASAKFSISASVVMEQLPKGAVKVAFGDLRKAAPVGFFKNNGDHDSQWVDLPLREILPQIGADVYSRREQRRNDVPEEITDLFGRKGELLARLRVLQKD
jgi:hypothetical protein